MCGIYIKVSGKTKCVKRCPHGCACLDKPHQCALRAKHDNECYFNKHKIKVSNANRT